MQDPDEIKARLRSCASYHRKRISPHADGPHELYAEAVQDAEKYIAQLEILLAAARQQSAPPA